MYWTLELASKLEDAPWPATKDELIDYAIRSGANLEVIARVLLTKAEPPGFIEVKGAELDEYPLVTYMLFLSSIAILAVLET